MKYLNDECRVADNCACKAALDLSVILPCRLAHPYVSNLPLLQGEVTALGTPLLIRPPRPARSLFAPYSLEGEGWAW